MDQENERALEEKRDRIVEIAERLLRQSGGEAFSMRALAAAANISLKTAYKIFGSKQGVMLEIFHADGRRYPAERRALFPSDNLASLKDAFILLQIGVNHYLNHEELYQYIFSVEDAVNNEGIAPARAVFTGLKRFIAEAIERGQIRGDVDPEMLAAHFTDLFSSAVVAWSKGVTPSDRLYQRIAYGYATTFAAIAVGDMAAWMGDLAIRLQSDPSAGTDETIAAATRAAPSLHTA